MSDWLCLLALQRVDTARPLRRSDAFWLGVHFLGLFSLWTFFQYPALMAAPLALLSLSVLLAPQWWQSARGRGMRVQVGALAPLLLVYALIVARLCVKYVLGWPLPVYAPGAPLDVGAALWSVENILLGALAYVALIQFAQTAAMSAKLTRRAGNLLFALTLGWALWEYVGHRTAGVTASDQYAYVQMALDWVRRGQPLHAFPLFETIFALNLPLFAGVHVGYHLPLGNLRDAPSVWPTGVSFLLALAYQLAGEGALYLVAPLCGLLVVVLVWLWARTLPHPHAQLLASLATLLLATSFEQVDRLLVPMADVPAELFSLLAMVIALRAPALANERRGRWILWGVLAGLSFALSYWIRHTQLLLGFGLLFAIGCTWQGTAWRTRAIFLAAFSVAALVGALPDLLYHQQVFGGVLHVESEELQHFSVEGVGVALKRLWDDFALGHEFGFIWPLTVLGMAQMARTQWRTFAALCLWVAPLLFFHLPYEALRLRDLLGELPPVMVWTAWGMLALPLLARRKPWLMALALLLVVIPLGMRTQTTLSRTFSPHRAGFGYLFASERADLAQLASLTERDAVIALTLHSGAVDLYAARATVRPNVWDAAQVDRFSETMQRDGRALYLLYDSPDLRAHLERLLAQGRLARITQFETLTFFGERDAEAGTLYRIVH